MYVCVCHAVTEQDIRRAVAQGAECFESLQARTRCATCCGCCDQEARELLDTCLESEAHAATLAAAA